MCPKRVSDEALQEREKIITDSAVMYVKEQAVTRLTMDKLVTLIPYSKGILYRHFCCTEDVLLAVGNQISAQLLNHYKAVASSPSLGRNSLSRFAAVNFELMQKEPALYRIYLCCEVPLVTEKASADRVQTYKELHNQIKQLMLSEVAIRIALGELVLPGGMTHEQFFLSCWTYWHGLIKSMHNAKAIPCDDGCVRGEKLFGAAVGEHLKLMSGVGAAVAEP